MNNYYKAGTWNVICDVCGKKYKADQIKKRWDGLMVCSEDWEPRHPQDFLRVYQEKNSVPYSRPESTDSFIGPVCPYPTYVPVADVATADCAIVSDGIPVLFCVTRVAIAGIAIAGCALTGSLLGI